MQRTFDRRDVLKGIGAAGVAGFAGCVGDDGVESPDAVMIVGFPDGGGTDLFRDFYSEFADDHPELDIVVPDGLISDDLPGNVGNDMNQVWGTSPAAGGPGADFFEESYVDAFDRDAPTVFSPQAYDAMAVLVLAAVAAGENDGAAIRDRIRTVANPDGDEFGPADLGEAVETVAGGDPINYVGASSSVDFDVNGDIVTAAYDIIDFENGELNAVDTVEFGSDLTEEDQNATAEDPVGVDEFEAQVGVLMPLTGDLGPLGPGIRDGALLAANQINDADVSVTVEAEVRDTQTNQDAAISEAESLVDAGFPSVVGPASSDNNFPVTEQVLIPNGVVGMSPSSTDPDVTDIDDDGFVFRTAPSDVLQGPALADLAQSDRIGAESTSTLFRNDAYGQSLAGEYVAAFEGDVLAEVSFEPDQSSYTTEWSNALEP